MGRFDRRHSLKMKRRKAQVKKKLRAKRRADERKTRAGAATKKSGKKSAG